MAAYYADTRALVKRHIPETGSARVRSLTRPSLGHTIITAQISLVAVYARCTVGYVSKRSVQYGTRGWSPSSTGYGPYSMRSSI